MLDASPCRLRLGLYTILCCMKCTAHVGVKVHFAMAHPSSALIQKVGSISPEVTIMMALTFDVWVYWTDLSQALIASEFGSARETDILDKKFGNMRRIVENSHG